MPVLLVWGLILSTGLKVQAQLIRGEIVHGTDSPIFLAAWEKDGFAIIDSVESGSGPFVFMLPEDTPSGVFRLIYNELAEGVLSTDRFVELIYNQEDLSLFVDRNELGPVPHFENSMENAVYQEFVDYQIEYEAELSAAYRRMFPTLPGDSAYEAALILYEDLQENRLQFMDSLEALYPGLYAIRIMNAFRVPVIPGHLSHAERLDTLKKIYFQLAPIDDPALLRAPVYSFRIVDFLSIFQDSRMDALSAEQEEAFIAATDLIMANVGVDPELRSFVVEFLLEGFGLLGLEGVQIHLADLYLNEQCTTDVKELVEERMAGYRAMQVGQLAPDLVVRDSEGRVHRLSELSAGHVLVLFWATTCEHCIHMMPQLRHWYREDNVLGVEVVSISIDSSLVNYEAFLEESPLPWISSRDPLGWNGSLAASYHIYATPSMFLLDDQRRIISRPQNIKQLLKVIRKLED